MIKKTSSMYCCDVLAFADASVPQECGHNVKGVCSANKTPCSAVRYVRAEVAMRYARMAYNLSMNECRKFWHDVIDYDCLKNKKITEPTSCEEAKQAAQREGN